MIRTLLKKQIQEMGAFLFMNGKNGKRRSKGSLILYFFLIIYALGVIGWMFYSTADTLCLPLIESGLGWLYFAIMGIAATALGVIGSIFSTFSGLYQAKDNELLLSMPIKPSKILFVRIVGIYLMNFLFEAVAIVPTVLVYWKYTAGNVVFCILLLFLLPVLALTVSCILGWFIALIASHLKRKNVVTVIVSLGFFAAYFFLISRANYYLQMILTNSEKLGDNIKAFLYPFYQMGLAAEGSVSAMLIFAIMVLAVFGLIYGILAYSFLKLATTKRGAPRAKYKEKTIKAGTAGQALLRKEFFRLAGSSVYMLNCCMGTLFLIVGAGFIVIKSDLIRQLINTGDGVLLACAAIALIASMNILTAPSISLEGKTLWLIQSLPVPIWETLKAKLRLHLILTAIPALICSIVLDIVLAPSVLFMILIPLFSVLYVVFHASFGLMVNLKLPNLNWSNETAAVKQGISVMIAMLGGWGITFVLGGVFLLFNQWIAADIYLLICTISIGALSGILLRLLKTKGTKMLAAL